MPVTAFLKLNLVKKTSRNIQELLFPFMDQIHTHTHTYIYMYVCVVICRMGFYIPLWNKGIT